MCSFRNASPSGGSLSHATGPNVGIDPKTKRIIFSDGLNLDLILKLQDRFAPRIQVAYGWGTNLTNDCGLKALSIVVKVIEAPDAG